MFNKLMFDEHLELIERRLKNVIVKIETTILFRRNDRTYPHSGVINFLHTLGANALYLLTQPLKKNICCINKHGKIYLTYNLKDITLCDEVMDSMKILL